ncbi:tetratricopeptide repeat protein [Veronia pacifica]|uniref:Uncharacterized protein n=1 Tax=Veronia pacifica TaxID=1080227 RepID=A0A1C3EE69_9GAMM|nr:tetratricopeptide repeat protein [Veronia pacifica]ODA31541.1 hypothetical protein A8L45_16720 [Veronia pacifica]
MKAFLLALLLLIALPVSANHLATRVAIDVNRAIETGENTPQQAIEILKNTPIKTPYERAIVNRVMGVFYYQIGDIRQAISTLSDAADSGELKKEQWRKVQRTIADLLLSTGQYAEALQRYYPLVSGDVSSIEVDEVWYRIGQSHYQLSEWDKSLNALARIQQEDKKQSKPVLSLKLGAQLELKHWRQTIPLLDKLISVEPDNSVWWRHLTSVYQRLGKRKDLLKTLVLMERQGTVLSAQEWRVMSQLYAENGLPDKAATALKKLTNKQLIIRDIAARAVFLQEAKEWKKAIAQWKLAAEKDSQYYWPLAQLQIQQTDYRSAINSLKKVEKPVRQGEIEMAMMMAYERLGELDAAYQHASIAHDIAPSDQTAKWLTYLNRRRQTIQP